jgi:V8-like Glu-specific endopeptidase
LKEKPEELKPPNKLQRMDKLEQREREVKKSISNKGEIDTAELFKKGSKGISSKNKNLNEPFPGYKEENIDNYRKEYSKKNSEKGITIQTRRSGPRKLVQGNRDDRLEVPDTKKFPYQCICKLYIKTEDGRLYHGTGSYIGPNCVLTVGHNVFNTTEMNGWPIEIEVIPGFNRTDRPFGSDLSNEFLIDPLYKDTENDNYDFAAILTKRPYGNELGFFEIANFSENELTNLPVTVDGYPIDLPPDAYTGQVQYYHTLAIKEVKGNRINYHVDASPGQSGSPVLCSKNGTLFVCGIHLGSISTGNVAIPISDRVFEAIAEWKTATPRL